MAVFVWSDFNTLAGRLAVATDEASLRSAVSRAYYALYGTTRPRALADGFFPPTTGVSSHKALWDYYRSSTNAARVRFGVDGSRLHRERTHADYDISYPSALPIAAPLAVAEATRLLAVLPTL